MTDGFRACACQRGIEDSAADGDLCLLGAERPRPQPSPDDGLVSTDRGLDQRPFAITRDGLPFHPAVCGDRRDMVVSLTGGVGVRPFHRVGARRNDDHGANAVTGDGVVHRVAVIGAVSGDLSDRHRDLVEQRIHLRGVTGVLIGHDMGYDLAAVGVQRQMQLSPSPPRPGAVLFFQPLAGAVDLEPSAIDEDVNRPFSWNPATQPSLR